MVPLNLIHAKHLCGILEGTPIHKLKVRSINAGGDLSFGLKRRRRCINLWKDTNPRGYREKVYDNKQEMWVDNVPTISYVLLLDTPRNYAQLEVKHGLLVGGPIFDKDLDSEEGRLISATYDGLRERYHAHTRLQRQQHLDKDVSCF